MRERGRCRLNFGVSVGGKDEGHGAKIWASVRITIIVKTMAIICVRNNVSEGVSKGQRQDCN